MSESARPCPDCDARLPADHTLLSGEALNRRHFLKTAAAASLALAGAPSLATATPKASAAYAGKPAETLVKTLYDTLTEQQRKAICFAWDHQDAKKGLLRTRVENNWNITPQEINSKFYTDDQRDIVRAIFENLIQPDWHARIDKQLEDDAGGFGEDQGIAIFGTPGSAQFEFVMTGRHMTLRCDGNSTDHVAFGGPIFYGHAAAGFNEPADHKGNVFWHQALEANKLYKMLDGKQQKLSLLDQSPREQSVGFRGKTTIPGIPVTEFSADQKSELQRVLQVLIEPYRQTDRDEVVNCLKTQGGLDACSLAFYRKDDLGNDGVWDNWRLEGPSFVWHYRGAPHVHVWVNVADSASVVTNT